MSEPALRRNGVEPPRSKRALAALLATAALCACSSQQAVTRLADGSYRVECEQPLLSCLEPAAKLCELQGYDLENAREVRDRLGPNPWQADSVKSSATVRCRKAPSGYSLFRTAEDKHASPPVSAAPPASAAPGGASPALSAPPVPAAPAAPGCVPGTSLACASPAGCSGAQVCAADGRSFGACECPPAATPASAAPAAAAGKR